MFKSINLTWVSPEEIQGDAMQFTVSKSQLRTAFGSLLSAKTGFIFDQISKWLYSKNTEIIKLNVKLNTMFPIDTTIYIILKGE